MPCTRRSGNLSLLINILTTNRRRGYKIGKRRRGRWPVYCSALRKLVARVSRALSFMKVVQIGQRPMRATWDLQVGACGSPGRRARTGQGATGRATTDGTVLKRLHERDVASELLVLSGSAEVAEPSDGRDDQREGVGQGRTSGAAARDGSPRLTQGPRYLTASMTRCGSAPHTTPAAAPHLRRGRKPTGGSTRGTFFANQTDSAARCGACQSLHPKSVGLSVSRGAKLTRQCCKTN